MHNNILLEKEPNLIDLYEYSNNFQQNYIVLNNIFQPEVFSIAPERIIKSYNDFENCQFIFNGDTGEVLHISLFLTEFNIDVKYIFQVISIINQLSESRFSLYLNEAIYGHFISYCNNHIDIIPVKERESLTIKTNMVISYGLDVIHFLRNKIPVFVLGPYGLGGLVTPVNLPFLFKGGFMGRPGGSYNERVAIEIIAHELGVFSDNKELDILLEQNKTIADTFSINPLSKEIRVQEGLKNKIQALYNNQLKRNTLKPKLCSNMRVVYNNANALIRRSYINDTLCTIDKADAEFFQDLNGKNTGKKLQEKYGMSEDDFWSTIHILLKKQIIILGL